jgi:hypothetical protein
VDSPPVEDGAARGGVAVDGEPASEVRLQRPEDRRADEVVPLDHPDGGVVLVTHPGGAAGDRLQHLLEVGPRRSDGAQHLLGRSLSITGLPESAVTAFSVGNKRGLTLAELPKFGPELLDRRGVVGHHDAPMSRDCSVPSWTTAGSRTVKVAPRP